MIMMFEVSKFILRNSLSSRWHWKYYHVFELHGGDDSACALIIVLHSHITRYRGPTVMKFHTW